MWFIFRASASLAAICLVIALITGLFSKQLRPAEKLIGAHIKSFSLFKLHKYAAIAGIIAMGIHAALA